MAAQASQTRIVNKAATLLGAAQRISSIADGSPLANAADAVWDETRDEVLADHPWNFALRRATPAAAAGAAVGEYAFAYPLESDCLRWLPWAADHDAYFEGVQEGRFILTDAAAPITVRYIARIEDMGEWSPGFTAAMAAKLAYYLAKPVTGQPAMMREMAALYDAALSGAKRQDGLASGKRQGRAQYRSHWLEARERPAGLRHG